MDINHVPPPMPFKHRLAITGRILGIGVILLLLLSVVLNLVMSRAKIQAERLTTAVYRAELTGGSQPKDLEWSDSALRTYQQHRSTAGALETFNVTKCFSQLLGTPAFCEIETTRSGGGFDEIVYFHGARVFTFHAREREPSPGSKQKKSQN